MTAQTRDRVVLGATWLLGAAYLATVVDQGWGPPDEGMLGQTAERLLGGELPHRDFDDPYTGGLTALHGLAFAFLGVRLITLRAVLFVAAVLWIPVFYAVARRFAAPLLAGAVTLLALAWSVPAYPASMPSWYNLFFATAGLWAALRYTETDRSTWLIGAGLAGGFSILAKITGIYFLAAMVVFLVYRALRRGAAPEAGGVDRSGFRRPGTWLGSLVGVGVFAAVLLLLGNRATAGAYQHLVLPIAATAFVLGVAGWNASTVAWERLARALACLALGILVALLPMVIVYARQHALADLLEGVFVLPRRRVRFAWHPHQVGAILWTTPLVVLAGLGLRGLTRSGASRVSALVAVVGVLLIAAGVRRPGPGGIGGSGPVYQAVVSSFSSVTPLLTVAFAAAFLFRSGRHRRVEAWDPSFAAVAVTAFSALIAFPYANDLYFHYVAPLICLGMLALHSVLPRRLDPRVGGTVIAFFLAFAVVRVRVDAPALLPIDRGGLRVPAADSAAVTAFVQLLRERARNGYTFATPDCPEAYFLTGLRNPTGTIYEFFHGRAGRTERILRILEERRITAVAIGSWGVFSGPPDQRLLIALRERYPDSAVVWHFTVRWKRDEFAQESPRR